MKRLLIVLLCLLLAAVPALANETDLTPPTSDDFESVDYDEFADDYPEEDWLYGDEGDLIDEGEVDDTDLTDDELAALFADDDGAPITQINEADQEDLLGAMEVYSWFALQPLDYDQDYPSDDGKLHRVLDERYNTPDLLKATLQGYFSDEIVDALWTSSVNPYTEIDGYLYTDDEGREMDPNIGETSTEVTDRTEDTVHLTSTVSYLEPIDGQSTERFTYERKLIDGQWKYTVFPFYW